MARHHSLARSRYHRPAWPDGPWPDDTQLLLLRACLLEDHEAAQAAWSRWRGRVLLDEIDGGSYRLLPLLHARQADVGLLSQDSDRIRGVARYHWVRYQQQLACLRGVLTALARQGIETLLLKGAALNLTLYPAGTRPMVDLDVVVPRRAARDAMQVLRQNGWTSSSVKPERLIELVHGCQFETLPGRFVDLHWDFFHGRILTSAEQQPFWDASEPVQAAGALTRVLCPAHQLLHTCVHGARFSAAPPLRWLADACWIVRRHAGRIDWDELVRQARQHELTPYVWTTLAFLTEQLEVNVPPQVLRALRRGPLSPSGRLQCFFASRRMPGGHPFWTSLPFHLMGYWKNRSIQKRFRLTDYLQLQHHYDLPLSHHLPRLVALQAADALKTTFSQAWAMWQRLGGRRTKQVLQMSSVEGWRLQGFHGLELGRHGQFRWSHVEASVLFTRLPAAACRVAVMMVPIRDWHSDLAKHLALWWNGQLIPRDQIVYHGQSLSFPVRQDQFAAGNRQRLTWRCQALPIGKGDTRLLGVPVSAIHIMPQAANQNGEAA